MEDTEQLLRDIEQAFQYTPRPRQLKKPFSRQFRIVDEVFAGKRWQDLDSEKVGHFADHWYDFTPEAFYYFLPGFLSCALKEKDDYGSITLFSMLEDKRLPKAVAPYLESHLTEAQRAVIQRTITQLHAWDPDGEGWEYDLPPEM